MTEQEIILFDTQLHQIALTYQQNKLIGCTVEEKSAVRLGDIYVGYVERVLHDKQGAYLDIGEAQNAFLKHPEQGLEAGQHILVQVNKQAYADKGVQVSQTIRLVAQTCVFCNQDAAHKVSRKITDEALSEKLLNQVASICENTTGSVTVRTNASQSPERLAEELTKLTDRWLELFAQLPNSTPGLRLREQPLCQRLARDNPEVTIKTNREHLAELPTVHYVDNLLDQFPLADILQQLWQRELVLETGERIIGDQTEAMMVFDVNSGSHQAKRSSEKAYSVNSHAADAIINIIALLNLSGIIVIDFINMSEKADQQAIRDKFIQASRTRNLRLRVGYFSQAGLLELTRARSSASLMTQIRTNCSQCDSHHKSYQTAFLLSLIELEVELGMVHQLHKTVQIALPATHLKRIERDYAHWLSSVQKHCLADIHLVEKQHVVDACYTLDWT